MISRMRTNGLAVLVFGLGLGGWALTVPTARAQGVGGFGGFGDSHPGMYGVGYGGLGFGMPGWGNGAQAGDIGVGRFSGPTLGYYGFGAPYYGHGSDYPYLRVRGLGFSYPWYGLGYGYGYGYPYHRFANHGAGASGFYPVDAARTLTGPEFPLEPVTTVPPESLVSPAPYVAPVPEAAGAAVSQGHFLGIDEEPAADANGRHGIKVARVYPGTAADRAGLKPGDVIRSINGYRTESRGNLAWIIANAASDNLLTMNVLTAVDRKDHTMTAAIP